MLYNKHDLFTFVYMNSVLLMLCNVFLLFNSNFTFWWN